MNFHQNVTVFRHRGDKKTPKIPFFFFLFFFFFFFLLLLLLFSSYGYADEWGSCFSDAVIHKTL